MLQNVLIVKLAKIVHCEFICISFSFVHAPVCANCNYSCNCTFIQKKKKKKKTTRTRVWVKIPKLCHNTPLSIFSLGKGRESLHLKTLHKTKYKCTFCPVPSTRKIQIQTKRGRRTSKLPKICVFIPANFAPFQ